MQANTTLIKPVPDRTAAVPLCAPPSIANHFELTLQRFRFNFRPLSALSRGYAGSAWRGGLGRQLKREHCGHSEAECTRCKGAAPCAYRAVFKPAPPPDSARLQGYTAVPRPYVIAPPDGNGDASPYRLTMTLIGDAQNHINAVGTALISAAAKGIGSARTRYAIEDIESESSPGTEQWRRIWTPGESSLIRTARPVRIPPLPRRVELVTRTPVRIRRAREYLVRPEQLSFDDLYTAAMRRVSLLTYFFAHRQIDEDFRWLTAMAAGIQMTPLVTSAARYTRYSSRQRQRIRMDGVRGRFLLQSESLERLWPYLWLGQWVHVGKGCTMGLGGYRLVPAKAVADHG